jgi:Flp pilus assembly pilin Flp
MKPLRAWAPKTSKGAALVEYVVLVGLIGVIAIVSVNELGNTVDEQFDSTTTILETRIGLAPPTVGGGGPTPPPGSFLTPPDPGDFITSGCADASAGGADEGIDVTGTQICVDADSPLDPDQPWFTVTGDSTGRVFWLYTIDDPFPFRPEAEFESGENISDIVEILWADFAIVGPGQATGANIDVGMGFGHNQLVMNSFEYLAGGTLFPDAVAPPSVVMCRRDDYLDFDEYEISVSSTDGSASAVFIWWGRMDLAVFGNATLTPTDFAALEECS